MSSFPNYDLSALHRMEMCMLEMIDYNVIVRQGLFAKYYFELRSISEEQNYGNMKKRHEQLLEDGWESSKSKSSSQAKTLTHGQQTLPQSRGRRRGSVPSVSTNNL